MCYLFLGNIIQVQQKVAYFGSGCFWCVEYIFEQVIGVDSVVSGYSGGSKEDANYSMVSRGLTDHAEIVAIYYDANKINYAKLIEIFFYSHDPTTKNQQGPDKGRQYRSVIFYQDEKEKQIANQHIQRMIFGKIYPKITTEVVEFNEFYPAESYHQNFKTNNPKHPYILNISVPRYNQFKNKMPDAIKENQ